jgi:hypothetical protein
MPEGIHPISSISLQRFRDEIALASFLTLKSVNNIIAFLPVSVVGWANRRLDNTCLKLLIFINHIAAVCPT